MRAALLALLLLAGCSRAEPPARADLREGIWFQTVMTGGPSLYWTCVNGDRVYALQPLASRATNGLWPGASIAVVGGGCR